MAVRTPGRKDYTFDWMIIEFQAWLALSLGIFFSFGNIMLQTISLYENWEYS